MAIILASSSERRRRILEGLGLDFKVIVPLSDSGGSSEKGSCPQDMAKVMSVEKVARILSAAKAKSVAEKVSKDDIVIAADTLVEIEGEALGKPANDVDALRMLKLLSGRSHRVFTGLTVIRGDFIKTVCECTSVSFRSLDDDEILMYIDSGEASDKAGAYGIQGRGAVFVQGISGDYFNVVGLPVLKLYMILRELGVPFFA